MFCVPADFPYSRTLLSSGHREIATLAFARDGRMFSTRDDAVYDEHAWLSREKLQSDLSCRVRLDAAKWLHMAADGHMV